MNNRISRKCFHKDANNIIYPSDYSRFYQNSFAEYWEWLSKQNTSNVLQSTNILFHTSYEPNIDYSFIFRFSKKNRLSDIIDTIQDFPDISYYWLNNFTKIHRQSPVLYGTYYIQKKLYDYQNSFDCSKAKYILVGVAISGIGSHVHVMGSLLAEAINHNRILVMIDNNDSYWIEKSICTENSLLCYFENMSQCQSYIKNTYQQLRSTQYVISNPKKNDLKTYDNVQYIYSNTQSITVYESKNTIPYFVQEFCDELSLSSEECLVYWRIQASTFISRLNKKFSSVLNSRLKLDCINCLDSYDVNIHIRSADKKNEMIIPSPLVFNYPINIIQKILNKNKLSIYINGDNDEDIKTVVQSSNNIFIYISKERRENKDVYNIIKKEDIVVYSFLNLRESLKSSILIGTYESNWIRLMIELKLTIGYGSKSLFFEVGHGNCITYIDCHNTKNTFNPVW
ncbi:hypothetical protein WA158_007942 [Blastocystis sp. Blastoise]